MVATSRTTRAARLGDGRFFLRKFLRDPQEVASVWPSSRSLARAMLRDVGIPAGHAVVELGPGTGAFTDAIAERLRGAPRSGYLGIDRDPEFVALLRERYPTLEFVVADATDLAGLLAARPWLRPAAVVSGLPLIAMPRQGVTAMIDAVAAALVPGGHFRTFSYLHSVVNPAQWWLRRLLRERFGNCEVRAPILRNLPPALVLAAVQGSAAAGGASPHHPQTAAGPGGPGHWNSSGSV